jgi:hypothetical protein
MNNSQKWVVILWLSALCSFAFAQNTIKADQGRPGNQGPWPVTIVSGGTGGGGSSGALTVTEQPCTNPVESIIVFDGGGATPIPSGTALANRRFITICNSPKNSGSPSWTIRVDGTAPTTAVTSPGQVIALADCEYLYKGPTSADGGVPIYGISDTNSSVLLVTECQ